MADLKPGWTERQYRKAKASIAKWPDWMKANLYVRSAVEAERKQYELAKDKKHG